MAFLRFASSLLLSTRVYHQWPTYVASGGARHCSSVKFDASDDDIADIIDRHVDKGAKKGKASIHQVLTTRREAIHLYRMIMRYTILFDWPDKKGELWRDKIRRSARAEFEAAKEEKDPEILNRLIVTSRDAVDGVLQKFLKKRAELVDAGTVQPRQLPSPYRDY